jgi:hypothetical protein
MILPPKAQWLVHRFRAMEPLEILSRLSDVGRHIALRALPARVRWRAQRQTARFRRALKLPECNGRLQGMPQGVIDRIIADATQWLNHRATLFALHNFPLGDPIDWHRDYSSGVSGPIKARGSLTHRSMSAVGDIKYVWELNRLQHLVLLALASRWSAHEAYRDELDRQILSWCAQNPFMRGPNWKSPLEAAIRLISWALVPFLTDRAVPSEDTLQKGLREVIYQHQYFIRKFYSKHSSANNHVIGEMAGLYVGSIFWPYYRESMAWRAFAGQKLIQEMARQVESDGVGKERATEYQLFILEFFLLAGALGQAIGEPFPKEYWARLAQMLTFLAAISDRDGNLPIFGDGDSGQALWLPETTSQRARALVRLGYPREGSAAPADLRTLLLTWGQMAGTIPLPPASMPAPHLHAFPQGGYYVLATERGGDHEMVAVFDVGPLGLHPLYAHGHADALSFWLSHGGHEFLVDPGTFCYHTHGPWRAYFRGTAAHNTIRLDAEDQSVPAGPFLWREVARCQVEHVEENDAFVEVTGYHNGYCRLADPVIHWRTMRLYKGSGKVIIRDRLECRRTHDAEVLFHFNESCQVRMVGPHTLEASNGTKRLILCLDAQLKPLLYRGSKSPIFGWVSRSFDVKEPSFTLVARAEVAGSTQFLTEITAS